MRYIRKGNEPEAFTQWKEQENEDWKPTWDDLRGHPKLAVHEALLQEQGFICCYCGQRIKRTSSHIEHFKPRSSSPLLKLDYANFLASCPGYAVEEISEEKEPQILTSVQPPQEHCGQHRGNWYSPQFMVSPLIENCADFFRYTGSGEIRPTDVPEMKDAAEATIQRLRLNHPRLDASRQEAIAGILDGIENLSEPEIESLIQAYDQPNANGEYNRFCAAVLYILRTYLGVSG
jgi:uncharacterized protein (TIGR02646 family)